MSVSIRELRATFWRARAEMRRMPVRIWLERAWVRAGGTVVYRRREDFENIRQLLDIVDQVNGGGRRCEWRELELRMHMSYGASKCPDGRVKVMTIHAAKGLEFAHVIVPFLHMGKPYSKKDLIMTHDEKKAMSVMVDVVERKKKKRKLPEGARIYWELRDMERGKDCEEMRRLLYVAATRAERTCRLTVTLKLKKDGKAEEFGEDSMIGQAMKLEELIRPDVGKCESGVYWGGAGSGGGTIEQAVLKKLVRRNVRGVKVECGEGPVKEDRRNGPGEFTPRIADFQRLKELVNRGDPLCADVGEGYGGRTAKDSQAAAIGDVVHEEIGRMLVAWPEEGMKRYGMDWERECCEDLWRRGATDVKAGAEEVRRHMREVLGDKKSFMKGLWELGLDGWSLDLEGRFCGPGVGDGRERRADLLVWDSEGTKCLVVDFKTGAEEDSHRAQVEEYEKCVREARSDSGVFTDGALYYTRTARVRWVHGESGFGPAWVHGGKVRMSPPGVLSER